MARVTQVGVSDLRFSVDETLAVLSATLGARCHPETGVRLHELTEGWPLGVQLAVAALHRGGDLESLLAAATADIQRYFIDTLIGREGADTTHLLVRLAQFDLLHPGLCSAVLGRDEAARDLLRLQQETPLLLRAEGADWMRLHPVAREVLRERLARLPQTERQAMARLASVWYAEHGLFEAAADQAFIAGEFVQAIALIEQTTHRMTVQGRSTAVVAWYQRLSPEELRQRPAFWAPAAWALAMSDRHAEALPLVDLMIEHAGADPAAHFEAALIRTVAAGFVDRVDLIVDNLVPWPTPPAGARPDLTPIHAVSIAFTQIAQGHCEEARLVLARITKLDRNQAYSPVSYGFADFGTGLSYLWEGRCALAEQLLRPALARAEQRMERRHPVACMLAALLLQAWWDSGQSDGLHTLLAGRMDVLDRLGLPDALMCAYRTLARIADHDGRQDQALHLLDSMRAIGQARVMPRLQALADHELVRLHARHGRIDTARTLSAQLAARMHPSPVPAAYVPWLELHAALAGAQAVLAGEDGALLPQALEAIETASRLASSLRRGGDMVSARLLRAETLRRMGSEHARGALAEALSLAQAQGMLRLLYEHGGQHEAPSAAPADSNTPFVPHSTSAPGSGLLTTKEREVLTLLARNLSNKEIALALDISEQTIKWHMKNLFSKLNSANRKHAVARARVLGLVEG